MVNFLHPDLQDLLIERIRAIARCELFDGVMIAGFHSNATDFIDRHFHDATDEEIIAATTRILREVRTRVRDDFLILVNTDSTKPTAYTRICQRHFSWAPIAILTAVIPARNYRKLRRTLLWAETRLRAPQINCLEGEGVGTSPPDSPVNIRWARVFTTLSLIHSDGYVLYTDGMRSVDPDASHHSHYWYPFWNANLGQPVGEKAQLYENQEGLFIREFTNGWVAYNRSGKPQKMQLPMQVTAVTSGGIGVNHTISDLDGEIYLKSGLETHPTADVNEDSVVK